MSDVTGTSRNKEHDDNIIAASNAYIYDTLTRRYGKGSEEAREQTVSIGQRVLTEMKHVYDYHRILLEDQRGKRLNEAVFKSMVGDLRGFVTAAVLVPMYQSFGDTLGYYNGKWEFNYDQPDVGPEYTNYLISEFISFGGINDISLVHWKASDDTLMYMATLKVLLTRIDSVDDFGTKLRLAYLAIKDQLPGRHGGPTTMRSLNIQENIKWDQLHYSPTDVGSGASMRSGCIGIFFAGKVNRKRLIALATEASRITHNSAIAILGSIVSALFTAYALERVPVAHWPHKLLRLMKSGKIDAYMKKSRPNEYDAFAKDKVIFIGLWEHYINVRFTGLKPNLDMRLMKNPVKRIEYLTNNFSKGNSSFPGSRSDDSVIFAYDALLESQGSLEKVVVYSILHNGDSDTVGSIALSWFGAMYHNERFDYLLHNRFRELEFSDQIYSDMLRAIPRLHYVYYHDIYLTYAQRIIVRSLGNPR